jgi:NAD(P)-dependent dehydrogenase (short-subunit alcohol dehydrogenase family)
MSLFDVSGKVACVTGASSGLGRAAATMLAEAGASVVGIARRASELEAWQKESKGKTAILPADLSETGTLAAIAEDSAKPFGPPDILVNAAGINRRQAADEVTVDGWDSTLALNLTAPFFLAKALVPAMKKRGWGRIVNVASLQSQRAFPNGISYGASKGGVVQLTRAFPTDLTAPVFEDKSLSDRNARQTCIGRNGELADLEGPLLFLCSQASGYVTGQVLFVDGGYTAK